MKITSILLLGLLVAGCANKPVNVVAGPVERATLNLPSISTIESFPVKWRVVTSDNFAQIMAELQKQGQDPVLFALTDAYYENLGLNQAQIKRLIAEQKALIEAYHQYYVEQDANITKQEKSFLDKLKELGFTDDD